MAKKKEEVKENENLEEEVVTEATEKVEETESEKVEVVEEKTETTVEDAKVEEKQEEKEAKDEKKEEVIETLKANTDFYDKYTDEKYIKGTEFIVANVKETKKIGEKQYKISKARAEEIKAKGYIE